MKFLDANVFIYAYYRPRQELTERQRALKEQAKEIIKRINEGEKVITTVIHLSEVSNILKRALRLEELNSLLVGLYSLDNVIIVDVTAEDYLCAIELTRDFEMDPNDCLAVEVMKREGVHEIYSFDRGFDNLTMIEKLP